LTDRKGDGIKKIHPALPFGGVPPGRSVGCLFGTAAAKKIMSRAAGGALFFLLQCGGGYLI